MYHSHYNFNQKPFQMTADPKFIWLGKKHAEALTALQNGLHQNKRLLVLTGNVGTGKTVVITRAAHQAGEMGGKVLQLTLANGGQSMIYGDSLSEEAVNAARAAEAGIIDGSITSVAEPR